MRIALAVVVGILLGALLAGAQAPAGMFSSSAFSTSCIQPPAGTSTLCIAGDKVLLYVNGGAPIALGGAAVAPAITINGTAKTLPATFTITLGPSVATTTTPFTTVTTPTVAVN